MAALEFKQDLLLILVGQGNQAGYGLLLIRPRFPDNQCIGALAKNTWLVSIINCAQGINGFSGNFINDLHNGWAFQAFNPDRGKPSRSFPHIIFQHAERYGPSRVLFCVEGFGI